LLVDVRVNLHAPALAARLAAQQASPVSVLKRAIIDTGSNVSGVSATVIQQLGLVRYVQSSTQGIGGAVSVDLYRVSLTIFDAAQQHLTWFVQPDLVVMELPPETPVDVLIGMDVLLDCRMLLDGPGRQFTLDF